MSKAFLTFYWRGERYVFTRAEWARVCGYKSSSTAGYHVARLEAMGVLVRDGGRARAYRCAPYSWVEL